MGNGGVGDGHDGLPAEGLDELMGCGGFTDLPRADDGMDDRGTPGESGGELRDEGALEGHGKGRATGDSWEQARQLSNYAQGSSKTGLRVVPTDFSGGSSPPDLKIVAR